MSDALIWSASPAESDRLARVLKRAGFRVKVSHHGEITRQWMESKKFDLLVVDSSISPSLLEPVASYLWRERNSCLMVAYRHNAPMKDPWEYTLLGAHVIDGEVSTERMLEFIERCTSSWVTTKGIPEKILVVEDLESPRDIICAFVEGMGNYEVSGVSGASEAFQLLKSAPTAFSCVITDINMPGINGEQLIGMMRQDPDLRNMPVVVLTAYGTTDCLLGCLEAGASGFLVKPPARGDINRELSRALRIRQGSESPRLATAEHLGQLRNLLQR